MGWVFNIIIGKCFASISGLVLLEPDQDDCPLPIEMILIDIDHPDP